MYKSIVNILLKRRMFHLEQDGIQKLWFLTGSQAKPELCYLIFICRARSWSNGNGAQLWAHITVSDKAQRAETPIDFSFSDLR